MRKDEVTVAGMLKAFGYDTASASGIAMGELIRPPNRGATTGLTIGSLRKTTRRRRTRIRATLCAVMARWGRWKATPASW